MIRVRLPGGFCAEEKWLAMDDTCGRYVKPTMRAINRACMDTVAACGDICPKGALHHRPSACSKELMDEILAYTYAVHDHNLPRTGAYHEIFLMHGDEMAEKTQTLDSAPLEEKPLYGKT